MNGDGMMALDVCRLNAVGGAIGGDISLKKLTVKCRHTNGPKVWSKYLNNEMFEL